MQPFAVITHLSDGDGVGLVLPAGVLLQSAAPASGSTTSRVPIASHLFMALLSELDLPTEGRRLSACRSA
jgi:hypothetical protein